MKIAHVIFSLNIGGAETMLIDIMNEQSNSNLITLFILNDSFDKNLLNSIDKHVNIISIKRSPGSINPIYLIKLNYLIRKGKYDIVHCHNSSMPSVLFPKFIGRKLIFTAHDLNLNILKYNRIKNIIAISDAVAKDLEEKYLLPIDVVYNGINCRNIKKRDSNLSFSPFKIVQVARLEHIKKGQDILIKALKILIEKGLDVEVYFIGDGSSKGYLEELCNEYNLINKVHFLGIRDRKYIYSNLYQYDLMCHPARYEGFGLTVAEGMAACLPVLVPDKGGPAEITMNNKYGNIFIHEDIFSCADAIENIILNYKEAYYKAVLSSEHVKEKYSIENMCTKYMEVYMKN